MTARILSVSYDQALLQTRELLLVRCGYSVTSGHGFTEGMALCERGGFDLFILGHSIPYRDKLALIEAFHARCTAPVLSLLRMGEPLVDKAEFHVEPDPRAMLPKVSEILGDKSAVA